MAIQLEINKTTCIKCGRCVKICPAHIFFMESPGSEVKLQNIQNCITCGHCVGVCPTDAVIHSSFPPQKVHKIEQALLPTPEQVLLLCRARRSNRAFSKKPIPGEMLEQVIEAAYRAPTASNQQEVEFTLVTDPEKLKQVIGIAMEIFHSMVKKSQHIFIKPIMKMLMPDIYRSLSRFGYLYESYKKGEDPILRNATSLFLIHTPEKSRFGCEDTNLAYQNASLMAESLGIGHFYTGFLCLALQQDKKGELNRLLRIKGKVHAGMALAMTSFKFINYIDKEDIKLTCL